MEIEQMTREQMLARIREQDAELRAYAGINHNLIYSDEVIILTALSDEIERNDATLAKWREIHKGKQDEAA